VTFNDLYREVGEFDSDLLNCHRVGVCEDDHHVCVLVGSSWANARVGGGEARGKTDQAQPTADFVDQLVLLSTTLENWTVTTLEK
jgi:hypothetical protein